MKQRKLAKSLGQVITLGILTGMRTTAAPALASHILSRNKGKIKDGPLRFMGSGTTAAIMKVLMAGELIGDKLPNTPDRIAAGGIAGRCLAGALAGATIFKATGHNAIAGAIIGSVTAAGSTFGCYYLRRFAGKQTRIPDPYVGAFEDVLVIGAGAGLIITA